MIHTAWPGEKSGRYMTEQALDDWWDNVLATQALHGDYDMRALWADYWRALRWLKAAKHNPGDYEHSGTDSGGEMTEKTERRSGAYRRRYTARLERGQIARAVGDRRSGSPLRAGLKLRGSNSRLPVLEVPSSRFPGLRVPDPSAPGQWLPEDDAPGAQSESQEGERMMKFRVFLTKNVTESASYDVEADSEDAAVDLAFSKFDLMDLERDDPSSDDPYVSSVEHLPTDQP